MRRQCKRVIADSSVTCEPAATETMIGWFMLSVLKVSGNAQYLINLDSTLFYKTRRKDRYSPIGTISNSLLPGMF